MHEAWDPRLRRTVAVKLLLASGVARVLQEARAQARLSHPSIVPVYDFGRYETTDGDVAVFIVMERVHGHTLRTWLSEGRSQKQIISVFLSAASGLGEAHTHGLVHRDFKPANVMVTFDGQAKILDFGLARVLAEADEEEQEATEEYVRVSATHPEPRLTHTGAVMGTPRYMAPEQYTQADVGPAADQFAFCQAFLEALRGDRLFPATDYEELAWAKRHRAIATRSGERRVPRRLERILLRGLEPDPGARWPSMQALAEAVERAQGRRPVTALIATAVIAIAAAGWLAAPTECESAEAAAERVWGEDDRARVRGALASAAPVNGRFVWMEVESRMDARVRQWAAAKRQACESFDGGRGTGCLNTIGASLRSAVSTLAAADASVAEHAVDAVASIPDPVVCSLANSDSLSPPQPATPVEAAHAEAVRAVITQAELQVRAGQFTAARTVLSQADMQAQVIDFEPLRLELALAQLDCSIAQGRLSSAEQELARVVADAEALNYTSLAARAAIALGRLVAIDLERNDDGARHLRRAEALVERLGGPATLRAELLEVRAKLAHGESRLADAERLRRKQLELLEQVGGQELRVADVLVQLGLNLRDQARFDEARATIQHAMEIQERLVGPLHPRTGHGLHALATIDQALEDYGAARGAIEQALAIFEDAYGPHHPTVALGLIRLADDDSQAEHIDAAQRTYERARAILIDTYGEVHSSVARVERRLGLLAFRASDFEAAETHYRRALRIHEQISGPDSSSAAQLLVRLGRVDGKAGRRSLGGERVAKALRIYEERFGKDHPRVAEACIALGHLWKGSDTLRAERHFRRALAIYKDTMGRESIGFIRTTFGLATVLARAGKLDEARGAYRSVIEAMDARGQPIGLASWSRYRMATILWDAGERPEAMAMIRSGLSQLSQAGARQGHQDHLIRWLEAHQDAAGADVDAGTLHP